MIDLTPASARAYLAARVDLPNGPWRITPLGGGVSNTVLLAESEDTRLVLKQALAKLRVQEDWFANRSRIHRESRAMRTLQPHLPEGSIPQVVFEDPQNYIYAMQAAPPGATDWKTLLLRGEVQQETAVAVARILNAQVNSSFRDPSAAKAFGDQTCFDELRLDPYYRFTASRHCDLAPWFEDRIAAVQRNACALVHGDFSPKNFLVNGHRVMLIDFEVIHYGDPAFDSGFLLNHLLLKSIHRPEWASQYKRAALAFWRTLALPIEHFERETVAHLGCLMLARVDGKSPAEYLTQSERSRAREVARGLITDAPQSFEEAIERVCH
jgi:5-methylthioribose kinase